MDTGAHGERTLDGGRIDLIVEGTGRRRREVFCSRGRGQRFSVNFEDPRHRRRGQRSSVDFEGADCPRHRRRGQRFGGGFERYLNGVDHSRRRRRQRFSVGRYRRKHVEWRVEGWRRQQINVRCSFCMLGGLSRLGLSGCEWCCGAICCVGVDRRWRLAAAVLAMLALAVAATSLRARWQCISVLGCSVLGGSGFGSSGRSRCGALGNRGIVAICGDGGLDNGSRCGALGNRGIVAICGDDGVGHGSRCGGFRAGYLGHLSQLSSLRDLRRGLSLDVRIRVDFG